MKTTTKKNKISRLVDVDRVGFVPLGDLQIQVMRVLWRRADVLTVHDVVRAIGIPPNRDTPYAYTTALTVLRILARSGFLIQRAQGRSHIFVPKVREDEYEQLFVNWACSHCAEGDIEAFKRAINRFQEAQR